MPAQKRPVFCSKEHKLLLAFASLLISIVTFSQQTTPDFRSVDSFAKNVKYNGNLDVLTKKLTGPYSKQLFKTRAIFKWITENICYDYKYYNKHNYKGKDSKTYRCRDEEDCEARRIAWEIKYIDRILRRKKAVCLGYSMLFKKMCDIAGLKAEVIPGYIRTEYYQVGTPGSLDHAWNSVWIDSVYYLLDATWAAGGCSKDEDGKLLFFLKNFKDYYWLTPSRDFIRNHYPKDSIWTLIPNYTKENFAANPYYASSQLERIKLITPGSGIVNARKGDTIFFKVDLQDGFRSLQINSNIFRNPDIWVTENVSKRKKARRLDTLAVKMQQYIKYRQEGNIYEFEYVVRDNSLCYLDILFDGERVMRFKVNIIGNEYQ